MNSYLVVFAVLVAAAAAMPRYALVPVEELRYMPRVRVARQLRQEPVPVVEYAPSEESERYVRQSPGGYDQQVDYGAYTGGYGAFGWYADYPVGGGYHRRR